MQMMYFLIAISLLLSRGQRTVHITGANDQMFHLSQKATAQYKVRAVPLYNQIPFIFSAYTSGYSQ